MKTVLLLALSIISLNAQSEIYKCTLDDGSTIYSDIPCLNGKEPTLQDKVNKLNERKEPNKSDPEKERKELFAELLNKSGKACGKATRVFRQGHDKDNAVYWNVACNNGQSYNIQVPADPSSNTRILECSIMKAIGVECFKKFDN